MSADNTAQERIAVVKGEERLTGAEVMAPDLRTRMRLVNAGRAATGVEATCAGSTSETTGPRCCNRTTWERSSLQSLIA